MEFLSTLSKMPSIYNDTIKYLLKTDEDFIKMNQLQGKHINIDFLDERYCESCGNQFPKLYRMGFCQNCFYTKPEAGESIIRPELSRAHEGVEDRDLAFEKSYQLQPHIVYLANSGGLKVGVTRLNQKFHRWIDQGAVEATVLAETSNRYEAGMIEVYMKDHLSDKTAWQRMLKNENPELDLKSEKEKAIDVLSQDLKKFVSNDNEVYKLNYPVDEYPKSVKSINLDKNGNVNAVLRGIKGQYLIFEGGASLNIRSHSGYRVKISF